MKNTCLTCGAPAARSYCPEHLKAVKGIYIAPKKTESYFWTGGKR